MLKLNIYKKKRKLILKVNSKSKVTSRFLLKAIEKSCVFDLFLTEKLRMLLLFVWVHSNFRKFFFNFLNFKTQCFITWRTGSVFSFFKLTRLEVRERSHIGFLNGIIKSSW